MKITMIGKSASGKTSYMSALHETLGENRVGDFSIVPTSSNLKDALKLSGDFDKVSFRYNNNKFPSSTSQTTVWSFDLLFGNSAICEIEWIDYRGGVLEDMFDSSISEIPDKSNEIEEILGHIAISNGIMLFADSIMLSQYESNVERVHHSGARVINKLMKLFSMQYPDRNLSLVIVLTKSDSDLIPQEHKKNNYEMLIERAKEAFAEVVRLCKINSGRWHGGIIAVGAIGEGKVKSKKNQINDFAKSIQIETEIQSFPVPFGVEHPLFFTIGSTLKSMEQVTSSKIAHYNQRIEIELSKSNLLRTFWCNLTGADNPQNTAKIISELLQKEVETLQHIAPHIKPIIEISNNKIRKI